MGDQQQRHGQQSHGAGSSGQGQSLEVEGTGVTLLSVLLSIALTVGLSLGFNLGLWWLGVLSGVAVLVALGLYIRIASDDGLLARIARWILNR